MPASILHAGRARLLSIAGCICLLTFASARLPAAPQHGAAAHSPFEKAQRMREALEGRPEHQRTRRDYERVMEAYRAIYHGDPASPKADASVSAVADLLAEEGRVFQDEKALHDAIGQYEFLRKAYPGSRYRFSALLTEGEIYRRDLNDRENARATFQEFLKLYPQNPLANEARVELSNLHKAPAKAARGNATVAQSGSGNAGAVTVKPAPPGHHTVLTAAIHSQEPGTHGAGAQTQTSPVQTKAVKPSPAEAKPAPEQQPTPEQQIAESDIPP